MRYYGLFRQLYVCWLLCAGRFETVRLALSLVPTLHAKLSYLLLLKSTDIRQQPQTPVLGNLQRKVSIFHWKCGTSTDRTSQSTHAEWHTPPPPTANTWSRKSPPTIKQWEFRPRCSAVAQIPLDPCASARSAGCSSSALTRTVTWEQASTFVWGCKM